MPESQERTRERSQRTERVYPGTTAWKPIGVLMPGGPDRAVVALGFVWYRCREDPSTGRLVRWKRRRGGATFYVHGPGTRGGAGLG